jgi:hypothetical protein
MKKVIVMIAVAAMLGGVAFATTLVVPRYNDGYPAVCDSARFPVTGNATFISITNNSVTTTTVSIDYFLLNGAPDGTTTTYNLGGHESLTWRPVGPQGGGTGATVARGTGPAGSVSLSFIKPDLSGIYGFVEINAAAHLTTVAFPLVEMTDVP